MATTEWIEEFEENDILVTENTVMDDPVDVVDEEGVVTDDISSTTAIEENDENGTSITENTVTENAADVVEEQVQDRQNPSSPVLSTPPQNWVPEGPPHWDGKPNPSLIASKHWLTTDITSMPQGYGIPDTPQWEGEPNPSLIATKYWTTTNNNISKNSNFFSNKDSTDDIVPTALNSSATIAPQPLQLSLNNTTPSVAALQTLSAPEFLSMSEKTSFSATAAWITLADEPEFNFVSESSLLRPAQESIEPFESHRNTTIVAPAQEPVISSNQSDRPVNINQSRVDFYIHGDDRTNHLYGGNGNDTVFGYHGNDHLYGHTGDDWLIGNTDADLIRGGTGNDMLWGGQHNDTLVGGAGNDILSGDLGSDVFVVEVEEGSDRIIGFSQGDRIGLAGGLTYYQLSFSQLGNDVIISLGYQTLATLEGVHLSALAESLFIVDSF